MASSGQGRHEAILEHLAQLLEVCCKGTLDDPDAPLPPSIIEPAVVLLLSTYPDCPDGVAVRESMRMHPRVDPRIGDRLANCWGGWCKLLHTAIPMGALSIHVDVVARLRSPALNELLLNRERRTAPRSR